MQIDECRKLLLSDTMVPDIFILEYLPELSGLAVKCYLFLLLSARTSRNITEQDLARRFGEDMEMVRTALLELAAAELIALKDRAIELADVKAREIERIYRPKTASDPADHDAEGQRYSRREKLMADIARTFFQGMMSPSWYGEIDNWFDRYGFEPEVIYALFQECARRNKLDSKAYIAAVAENWSKRGIITFNDLNQYFLAHEKISKVSRRIGRKLRKRMTEYDDEMVARWIEQLGYDFDVIELALRKTTRLSQPNLSFIDRLLQEWFEHQLRDGEAINAYEAEKAARLGKERHAAANGSAPAGQRRSNQGNFDQRDYSREYLDGFYEAVEAEDEGEKPAKQQDEPQQVALTDLMKQADFLEDKG